MSSVEFENPMHARRGPKIRIRGLPQGTLETAVEEAYRERARSTPEEIERFLETEHPEILGPLKAARGVQARYATYLRLRPGRIRPVGRFPAAPIGAVAVVLAGREDVLHSDIVARKDLALADPDWALGILGRIQAVADVTILRTRAGRDCGTLVVSIAAKSPSDFRIQVGAIQASLRA